MGTKKIIALVLALFLLIFALCIIAISLDDEPVNDANLVFTYSQIPFAENGYMELYRASRSLDSSSDIIKDLDSEWNSKKALEIVELHAEALKQWEEALKKAKIQVPEIKGFDTLLPYLASWRDMARLASIKARLLAEQGEIQKAVDLSFQIIEFGQKQETSNGCLINYLVAIASKYIGVVSLRRIVRDHDVPNDLLKSTIERLKSFKSDRDGMTDAIKIEYTISKKIIQSVGRRNPKPNTLGSRELKYGGRIPFLFKRNKTTKLFADNFNTYLENIKVNYHKRKNIVFRKPKKTDIFSGNVLGQMLYGMLIPDLAFAITTLDKIDSEIGSLQIELAVNRYRKENNGNWPDSIDDLKPEFINEIPLDPFSKTASPLKYNAEKRIIYSVGFDGVDNGGPEIQKINEIKPYTILWGEFDDNGILLDRSLLPQNPDLFN